MSNIKGFRRRLTATALIVAAAMATFPAGSRAQVTRAEKERIDGEFQEASGLITQGKHDEAIALLQGTLARVRSMVKPGDMSIGHVMNSLGRAYAYGSRYREAEAMFRESIRIGEALPGDLGGFRYMARESLIAVLVAQGKVDEALPIAEAALKEMEVKFGVKDERTIHARDNLARAYFSAKRFEDAMAVSRQALNEAEITLGADHPDTIPARTTLAMALMELGKFEKAKTLLETSRDIAKRRLPPNHDYMPAILNGLANCNWLMGHEKEAADIPVVARPGASADEVLNRLNILAMAAIAAGDYKTAESHLLDALKTCREKLGPVHPMTSRFLVNLAVVYIHQGRYGEGERLARQSEEIIAKNSGLDTVEEANVKSNLSDAYMKIGRYVEAKPLLEKAYDIVTRKLPADHPQINYVRNNLAALYAETKHYKEAAQMFVESLTALERRLGPDNPKCGTILTNLGWNYLSLSQYEKAETALRRASAIFAKSDPDSAAAATVNNPLSLLCMTIGKREEAEALMRRTVAVYEKLLGPEHPRTADAMENLSSILIARGRLPEAVEVLDRSRRLQRAFLLKILPAFQDDDQIAMIDSGEQASRDAALTLALHRRSEPAITSRSAEWVLNCKAITVEASSTRAVLAREVSDPETAGLLAELDAARNRLATLAHAPKSA